MLRFAAAICVVLSAQPLRAAELTLDQQLIVACFDVRVDEVVRCLRNGADVNARFGKKSDENGEPFRDRWFGTWWLMTDTWSPLLAVAASHGYPDPPVELGEISGKTSKDRERAKALWKAIPKPEIDARARDAIVIMQLLLSHGCKLDDADGRGATALYIAVNDDKVLMAKTLLQFGANPNTKTGMYIDGCSDNTPLHRASHSQELIRLLLDYGADGSAKDSEGRTPADWVAFSDDRKFDLVKTPDGWRIIPREKEK